MRTAKISLTALNLKLFPPLQPPLSLQQITLHQLKSSNRHLNSSNRHLSLQQITLHQLNSSNRHLSLQQITLHRLKSSNRHLNSSNRHLSLQQITLHRLNNCSVKGQLNHLCRDPIAPKGPPASFQAKGTINSVIAVPQKNWIATGNWIMTVNYGNLTGFRTNMSWVDQTGTATHTHEFLNFRPSPAFHVVVQQPKDTILARGLMDVGTNNKVVWKDVPSVISIKGGKTISISLNDKATNSHFASQPILGVVKSYERCSDIPGPDMVVLPSCS